MTVIRRRRDWVARLEAEIAAAAGRRWRWGDHDCLRFPARCIDAMTGADPAAGYRDVRTKAAVDRQLAGGLVRLVGDEMAGLGFPEIAVLKAGRGDAVIVETAAGRLSGGIVALDGRAVFAATRPGGLVDIPLAAETVRRAWRVG